MATLEAPVRPARANTHSGPFVTEPFFDFRNEENARVPRSQKSAASSDASTTSSSAASASRPPTRSGR